MPLLTLLLLPSRLASRREAASPHIQALYVDLNAHMLPIVNGLK